MAKTRKTEENPEKLQKPMKMTANQIAIMALSEQGLSQREIAKELGISSGYPSIIQNKYKRQYSLQDTKLVKAAHKAVKSLLKGEPFGSITEVKDSTSLQAAKMVYDRVEPLKQVTESTSTVTIISEEQRRRYHEALGLPIDADFTSS